MASKSNRYIRNGAYVAPPGKQKQTSKTITSIDDVDRASEKQKLLRRPETIEEANAHTDLDFDEAISVTHNMYKLIPGLSTTSRSTLMHITCTTGTKLQLPVLTL